MAISDIELLNMQVETLFVSDDFGRLRFINEPYDDDARPAPNLFVGIARYGSIVRFGSDLPESVCKRIEVLIGDYVHIGDVRSNPPFLDDLMDVIRPYLNTDRVWESCFRLPQRAEVGARRGGGRGNDSFSCRSGLCNGSCCVLGTNGTGSRSNPVV